MAMLKFLKGDYSRLSTAGIAEGQVLICGDTGEMFVDVSADKRVKIGDFITVANITALEALDATSVPTSRLYYVEDGNILARSNGTSWVQVNKQPDIETLKTNLGLGSMAYVSEVSEDNLASALKEKVNAASEGNHSHANKALLDTYTQTEENLADAVAKKHEHANKTELDKIASGDKAKWDAVAADHLTSADKTALEDSIGDVNTALGEEVTRAKAAEQANANAIAAIKDDANIDSFADVVAELAKKQNTGDYATKAEAQAMADAKDAAIAEAKKAGTDAATAAGTVASNLSTHITEAEGKYETKDDASAKLTEAKDYTDTEVKKVQDEVDALETYVGTIPSDYTEENVIAYINKKAEETLSAAQGGSSETAASVKQQLDNYKSENNTKVQANTDAIAAIKDGETLDSFADVEAAIDGVQADVDAVADSIGTVTEGKTVVQMIADAQAAATYDDTALAGRVSVIEGDYLKTADKTALQNQITANANAIELLTNGVSAEEVDGVNDLIQYVNDHGTEVTGIKNDIKANAEAIDAIEADYLKAADKTELQGNIDGVAGRMTTAEGEIDALQAASATHAVKTEVEAELAKKVDKVEGKSLVLDTEITKLAGVSEGANKVEASENNGKIKIDGVETTVYTHPEKHTIAEVDGLQDALDLKLEADDIAGKANAADVYAKTETYSKTEIEGLLTWGSF